MPKQLLEAVLPPGKSISAQSKSGHGSQRCRLEIDGNTALSAGVEWYDEGRPLDFLAGLMMPPVGDAGFERPHKLTPDKRFLISDSAAVGLVKCADPSYIDRDVKGDLFTKMYVLGGQSNEEEIKSLITAYTEAMTNSAACRNEIW
ncbi:hypothetical protein ACFPM3_14290 [Streptomyces coeruleoprunus]|uniref:Uncharacterized protein n=1 Tax=Streptomyces coeruleoprunus TaxID=285563 RepID=A0ABV9XDK1_9ACTN